MIPILIEVSVRALVIIAGVGLVLWLARVRAGAWRHAAWTTAVVAMLASPVIALWRPSLPVEVPRIIAIEPESLEETRPTNTNTGNSTTATTARPSTMNAPATPAVAAVRPPVRPSWISLLGRLWLFGFIVMIGRIVIGWRLARRLRLSASEVPSHEIARQGSPILESPLVAAPIVVGMGRPAIILPTAWRTWPRAHLEAALAHERAHIRRKDGVVCAAARLNLAIYWFHPAAWWLDQAIARAAEEACDDEVVQAQGHDGGYASVLVETARAIHAHGRRVSWHALGIGGGRLESRVDRVLSGEAGRRVSRRKLVALVISCLAIVLTGAACQQQPAPLHPNADYTSRRAAQAERMARFTAAQAMSEGEASALEAKLAANPDDLEGTEAILHFYQQRGPHLFGWNEMVARRRPHLIRLIARHPDSPLANRRIVREHDPAGYAEARALWMAHAGRPDASPTTLAYAADFISPYDKPAAEALLMRAIGLDPTGPQPRTADGLYHPAWSQRLGELYARGILGFNGHDGLGAEPAIDPIQARGPFARHAREVLATTTDVDLLASASQFLVNRGREATAQLGDDFEAYADSLLQRATTLAPESPRVRRLAAHRAHSREHAHLAELVRAAKRAGDATLSTLSDQDLFRAFVDGSNWIDFDLSAVPLPGATAAQQAERKAAAARASRAYAERALAHAERFRSDPDHGTVVFYARLRLSLAALDEGDRREAVEHLEAAMSHPAPALRDLQLSAPLRPVNELLRAGERESVVRFLERLAEINVIDRDRWLADAKTIQSGQMTMSYQSMFGPR